MHVAFGLPDGGALWSSSNVRVVGLHFRRGRPLVVPRLVDIFLGRVQQVEIDRGDKRVAVFFPFTLCLHPSTTCCLNVKSAHMAFGLTDRGRVFTVHSLRQ